MQLNNIKQLFFIGIGGIGMSAIARFFSLKGCQVAGYDRTPSPVTDALQREGIQIVFSDEDTLINSSFCNPESTLIVYTPAVSAQHRQLTYFRENGFRVLKRSQVLGLITEAFNAVCVAGTHGKTTISTLTAHLYRQSRLGCVAFLGGISKNYDTNFLWDERSRFAVVEADEFDRSFLMLTPQSALVSSVDADHLDIYGNKRNLTDAFVAFGERIVPNGNFIVKSNLPVRWKLGSGVNTISYSLNGPSDYFAANICRDGIGYRFDLITPATTIGNLKTGVPGLLNVENAVAACAMALVNGVSADEIRAALPAFTGIARRFDIHINTPSLVYIDDYAHHPEEIRATLKSVRAMYPEHHLTTIFQPHLFTRTRDFYTEFAETLGIADELILLDIYPAREEPIEGVTSKIIGDLVKNIPVRYCSKSELAEKITVNHPQTVIITMGAGDIDREVARVKEKLSAKME
ncbi:MAG: UDP-N-acetylmuramate--L-alanine ligase [Cytophagaceae bacterium]|jgi:UDP-N-acetylmuramate--alanine ligase|nr:UDP-N-acetylmuramate--L-alanine ligase [Cytophagaceae bacterium]